MPPTSVIAAVIVLMAFALFARITLKTWLHPGAFFALVWVFEIVFSLAAPLVGVEQYHVWHGALWWIGLMFVCVYLGGVTGAGLVRPVPNPSRIPASERDLEYMVPLLAAGAIGSLVWPIAVPKLVAWGDHPPMYLQVFLGLHYMGPVLAGMLFPAARDQHRQ